MVIARLKRLLAPAREVRTCCLHIGPHKTGTTSIQRLLRERASALEKAGINVPDLPDAAGRRRLNHAYFASARNFGDRPTGASLGSTADWGALSEWLDGQTGSVVLSGEGFASRTPDRRAYEDIVGFFLTRGFRVVVMGYVRDQPHWLNSWFTQQQKGFHDIGEFDAYVARMIDRRFVDPWTYLGHALADDRVETQVVSFERAIAQGLERDFLDRIGAAQVEPPPVSVANPNAGAKGVFAAQETARRAGMRLGGLPGRARLARLLRRLGTERGWESSPFMGFDQAGYDAVRDRFRPGNDRLANRAFATDWSELCPPRSVNRNVFDPATASDAERAEVEDVVGAVLAAVHERPALTAADPASADS